MIKVNNIQGLVSPIPKRFSGRYCRDHLDEVVTCFDTQIRGVSLNVRGGKNTAQKHLWKDFVSSQREE